MKKSILVVKSLVLAGVLFFVSCNDNDTIGCPVEITGELSDVEIGFSGKWVLSGIESEEAIDVIDDGEDNPSKDVFSQYSKCDRDLVYNFARDRKYLYKQGSTAEDCNNKLDIVGTWGITGKNILTFVANCSSQTVDIEKSESGDEFSYFVPLTFKDATGTFKSTKVTFTYKKVGEVVIPQ